MSQLPADFFVNTLQDFFANPQMRSHGIHDNSGTKIFKLYRSPDDSTLGIFFTGYSVQDMTDMFQQINDALVQICSEFRRVNIKFDKEFHAVFNELKQFRWIADFYEDDFCASFGKIDLSINVLHFPNTGSPFCVPATYQFDSFAATEYSDTLDMIVNELFEKYFLARYDRFGETTVFRRSCLHEEENDIPHEENRLILSEEDWHKPISAFRFDPIEPLSLVVTAHISEGMK